ncbi:hypothetical protein ACJMK2_024026, partial [Sinanodonta woodiana]
MVQSIHTTNHSVDYGSKHSSNGAEYSNEVDCSDSGAEYANKIAEHSDNNEAEHGLRCKAFIIVQSIQTMRQNVLRTRQNNRTTKKSMDYDAAHLAADFV